MVQIDEQAKNHILSLCHQFKLGKINEEMLTKSLWDLIPDTPDTRTSTEKVADLMDEIREEDGLAITHISNEWQAMRQMGDRTPSHCLLNISITGDASEKAKKLEDI